MIAKMTLERGEGTPRDIALLAIQPDDRYSITLLDSGNVIQICMDEQGDTFVKIDGHEVWDNSCREEEKENDTKRAT